MPRRIVEQSIKKLKSPEQGNRIKWDGEIPGFGVRVTAAGVVSFVLDYRFKGTQRRYTIGLGLLRRPERGQCSAAAYAHRLTRIPSVDHAQ